MRSTDPLLAPVLRDSVDRRITADLYVGLERVLTDLDCKIDLTWDGGRQVLCQGSLQLVYQDDWGRSLAPERVGDWLAPFGSWLDFRYDVTVGSEYSRSVRLGRLAVQKPRDVRRQAMSLAGRTFYPGEQITVDVADAFAVTARERFVVPGQPPTGATAWGELARLSGWPILRNLPDVAVPSTVAYQENRLEALFDIGDALGGSPYLRNDNTLTIRPYQAAGPVAVLQDGPEGQILSYSVSAWDADEVYNQVVVRITNGDQVTQLADAKIKEGRLRYGLPSQGAYGRIPFYVSSEYIKTAEQAQAYADSRLQMVSQQKTVVFTATILPDPRLEVGDVVVLAVAGKQQLGRIQKVAMASTGPMKLEGKIL